MYTLVLMSALSTAPDTAEFNDFFRRLFTMGGGCCGGSCTGSGSGSRLRAYTSCCGGSGAGRGYGSCTGSSLSAGSCTGSGYASCSGGGTSYSCSGGLMTAPGMGFDPGYATPSVATQFYYPSYYPTGEPGGCFGSGMSTMGGMGMTPTIPPIQGLQQPYAPPMPATPDASIPDSRGTSFASGSGGGRATVVVKLPADAVLYAEGRRLVLSGAERTFTTPSLPAGDWGYTFRAEYTRDGEVISRSKRVGVKPGDAVVLEFTETGLARTTKAEPKPAPVGLATTAVPTVVPPPLNPFVQPPAQPPMADRPQPATLTIKVPPGATLTVDGKKVDRSGDYRTPPLAPGREYSYQVLTEETKDGQPLRTASKVSFRAGELVVVDLTSRATNR